MGLGGVCFLPEPPRLPMDLGRPRSGHAYGSLGINRQPGGIPMIGETVMRQATGGEKGENRGALAGSAQPNRFRRSHRPCLTAAGILFLLDRGSRAVEEPPPSNE